MEDPVRKHICIVGNSASLKGRGLGSRINQFDNVCRINDWVVNKHQNDVGSKINYWVAGAGRQIPKWSKNRSLKNKNTIILWPYALFNTWKKWGQANKETDGSLYEVVPEIKVEVLNRLGYKPTEYSIWKDNDTCDLYDTRENITFVPDYVCKRIAENTVAYPTTGLATIAYFKFVLKYNVYTVGFDFFLKEKDHYWDGKSGNSCKIEFHDLQREKDIYDGWIREGLIKEL